MIRVLLVEDNADEALLMQRALRRMDPHTVLEWAADGEAAQATLENPHSGLPKVVFLDLKLPRKSGLELLAWIRSEPRLQGLPVVVMSTSSQPNDIRQSYASGANSFLVKPTTLEQLGQLVETSGRFWLEANQTPY